jgi:hypothetical protein
VVVAQFFFVPFAEVFVLLAVQVVVEELELWVERVVAAVLQQVVSLPLLFGRLVQFFF